MKTIIAIDPGTTESAIVEWYEGKVKGSIMPNEHCLAALRQWKGPLHVAVEMVACYGMPVGREVFETCLVIGRMQEIYYSRCLDPEGISKLELIYRRDVKMHHCGSARAKDSNIRQALIDKYGEPGTKKSPGKTYGLKSHLWAAFAIATYVSETQKL